MFLDLSVMTSWFSRETSECFSYYMNFNSEYDHFLAIDVILFSSLEHW